MTKELWIKAYGNLIRKKKCFFAGMEAGADSVILDDKGLLKLGRYRNVMHKRDVPAVVIKKPGDMRKAEELLDKVPMLIVELRDWNIIPMENLIASSGNTRIIAEVRTAEEAAVHLNALEKGVDGVLVDSMDPEEVRRIMGLFTSSAPEGEVRLDTIEIKGTRNIDEGDRVCVDTCTMMEPGEGMLIGSMSSSLFLVGSEAEENGYMEARPFRVNAGALHSYILLPNGDTGYLSELRSGSPVAIADTGGEIKKGTVGRCKIERRPLIMIEGECNGSQCSVILQNAETVRLMGPEGPIPVTSVRAGDVVFGLAGKGGRHCGATVDETIREL